MSAGKSRKLDRQQLADSLKAAQQSVRTFLKATLAVSEGQITMHRERAKELLPPTEFPRVSRQLRKIEAEINKHFQAALTAADELLLTVAQLAAKSED